MALFDYEARDRNGGKVRGSLEAESAGEVAALLGDRGLIPIRIEPGNGPRIDVLQQLRRLLEPPVRAEEIVMFCRQMRTLLKAGVPILRALKGLAENARNPRLKQALSRVLAQLQEGLELNMALAQHPALFSPLFIAMVRVGESTGRLEEAFAHLAEHLEMEKQTRERVRTALRYPLIVLGAIVVAVVIINIWVIPAFANAFARYDAELPLMTRILITTSDFFRTQWPLLLFGGIGALVAVRQWLTTTQGRRLGARWLLRMPLIGPIVHKAVMGRFAQSLSMTLNAGVPLVQALKVVAGVVDNVHVAERIHEMRKGIEKGESITRTAAATGLFTPLVLQMLAVGEESGALDELLTETARHYLAEVEFDLKRLSDAIEPIVIVIIGMMVTVLALGVFLPLWDLSSAARP
jgi:MSHA biogenesis protein MshG